MVSVSPVIKNLMMMFTWRPPVTMSDIATEFVAYVLECLPPDAAWLSVWDEAQAVARRRAFRGMGYSELLRAGVPLSLDGADLLSQIVDEQKHRVLA